MPSRRFAIYFAWSRPREFATPPGVEQSTVLGTLENRYPTLFEFRRAVWPAFESLHDPRQFNQSIAGFFDHVILPDFEQFCRAVREVTGHEVTVMQRETDAPPPRQLDDALFKEIDTLIVVSLDHSRTGQTPSVGEIQAVRAFLQREDRCVVICPHHDIGSVENPGLQQLEFRHHGDVTIPCQQRLSGFARGLLAGLGVQIENQFGLNPAQAASGEPAALLIDHDAADASLVLSGVTTFNLHPHLPHLYVPPSMTPLVDVLARQPINPRAPRHVFTDAGNQYFNAMLRIRPPGVAGRVLVCDATLWSSAFGGLESLRALWGNLARMPLVNASMNPWRSPSERIVGRLKPSRNRSSTMTLRELGVGKGRTFQQARLSTGKVEFLAAEPRPTVGGLEAANLMAEAFHESRSRFQELPAATGAPPYRLALDDILAAGDIDVIRTSGKMVLHTCGDTGGVNNDQYQRAVVAQMTADFDRPRREDKPAFFFHLGDVVYFKGEQDKYYEQFYDPYEHYPAPIVAIPGNHDGEWNRGISSLQAFVANFCAPEPGPSLESQTIPRDRMTQPNVYFTLLTPLATIVGLYSNVPEGGEVRDDQAAWFTDELRAAPADRPLIVAVHHPVFSADVQHSGSPVIKRCIERAMTDTGRVPDLILTGHVHNYQRFTWRVADRQIPVIVAGGGGYPNLHKVAKVDGEVLRTPFELADLNATLEAYTDSRHGFLRLEITHGSVVGKYYALPAQANERADRVDRFQLDLVTHRVVG